MAQRYKKAFREQIVREFAVRHNGQFNPAIFLDEVRRVGEKHPAFGWFEWDQSKAAEAWQLEQARAFARDLRVTFTVEEVHSTKAVRVVERELPMVLSPVDHRRHGGGYWLTDGTNPEHMKEHCRQAAQALGSWASRYGSAVEHIGSSMDWRRSPVARVEMVRSGKPQPPGKDHGEAVSVRQVSVRHGLIWQAWRGRIRQALASRGRRSHGEAGLGMLRFGEAG